MGVRTGVSLKVLQFLFRGITFGCAIVVLGIYAYFLATLRNHSLTTPTWVRAVEGLSGSAALYSLIGLLLLWCLAGHTLASLIAVLLDICFIVAFLYVAVENRGGASRTCKGDNIRTPFGTGSSNTTVVDDGHGGIIELPSFRTACKLETASLAVSVIAIVALVLSAINEILLHRNHRREKQHRHDATAAAAAANGTGKRRLGPFGRRRKQQPVAGDDTLPVHQEAGLAEKPPATYGNPHNY